MRGPPPCTHLSTGELRRDTALLNVRGMTEVIVVAAPPAAPTGAPPALATRLIPVVTLLITGGMVAVLVTTGSALPSNPMFLMFPAMLVVSALTSVVQGAGRQSTAELNAGRRRYLGYLHDTAGRFSETAAAQRRTLLEQHPDPDDLWLHARGGRRGERHHDHDDFGRVRVGLGFVAAGVRPVAPDPSEDAEVDTVTVTALHRFIEYHSQVAEAPVTVDLRTTPLLRLGGEHAAARATARALLCQLATFHRPAEVAIVAVTGTAQRKEWEWLKWLPHHADPTLTDDLGPARLAFPTGAAASARGTDRRLTVTVFDGVDAAGAESGIWIAGPAVPSDLELSRPDTLSGPAAVVCARSLAAPHGAVPDRSAPRLARLQVPLGVDGRGDPVHLDINEAARGGAGPHGLCLGATGSGKSELLRTVASGMIARHTPEDLNLILVDFKGGATFLDFERAPHVSAVITNLADEAYLVDRMQDALSGEIHRRQQLLRAAGNLAGVAEYARARSTRPELPVLPSLFLIVDEFAELLSQHPDFIDQFVAIGRLGRSLGIHLLLASQRLDEGRLRGLESHLSYRICLKTLSPSESRAAIGTPDAYQLPARPGAAYLKIGADDPVLFQAAHVSGPATAPHHAGASPAGPMLFTSAVAGPVRNGAPRDTFHDRRLLDVVLDTAATQGPVAHRVWLPPLLVSPTLDAVLAAEPGSGALSIPVGLADRAFEQRLEPVVLDLSGAAGNVAVVGAPRSGKSTALLTLALGLGVRYEPTEVALYCLDFGGGALGELAGMPHVGVVATRQQPELVRRTVAHIAAELRRRETAFHGGHVVLVIDGWATVRNEFDDLEGALAAIATEGLAYGIHLVLTATRWADIRPALKDQIGTRIELRLGDPVDSDIDRGRARLVPANRPGSGLTPDGRPMMLALP
ncbi:MAG: eccC, partial [Mycobacterium sp.]|nr:eccC [Mycobacterium sp.]